MPTCRTATTSAVPPAVRASLRAMLEEAFPGDFSDDDWAHTLGGTHVWVADAKGVISHAALVERSIVCAGVRLRVGFVEAVATAAAHRRRGHGARVMAQIGALIQASYPLGVLSTDVHAFYAALGWERWRGPTWVERDGVRTRTPADDGDIMVLRTARTPPLDLDGDIVCDWRSGDVW